MAVNNPGKLASFSPPKRILNTGIEALYGGWVCERVMVVEVVGVSIGGPWRQQRIGVMMSFFFFLVNSAGLQGRRGFP